LLVWVLGVYSSLLLPRLLEEFFVSQVQADLYEAVFLAEIQDAVQQGVVAVFKLSFKT
jgi:hypothetical protein